jgi:hypothetical protein
LKSLRAECKESRPHGEGVRMFSYMKRRIFFFVLLFIPYCAQAEPVIRSFFPRQGLLLGQPLIWIVELRYPIWESYELKFGSCPDLQLKIADQKLTEVAGELRAVYRIAVAPTALKVSCAPALIISDEKGQTTVLNGKPVTVHNISGESEEIKMPALPSVSPVPAARPVLLYLALAGLVALCGVFTGKRIYNNTPRQRFLRDIRKAIVEVQNKRLPIQVWRLLRSEMVWGFPAEAFTPSQLSQKGNQNIRLLTIASALQSLEKWRYSDSQSSYDQPLVVQALGYAADLTVRKPRPQRAS